MNDTSPVEVRRDAGVGILELARPRRFNCLSTPAFRAIEAALDAFEAPGSGVRAVLVQAQGPQFCTGADLDEVLPLRADAAGMARFIQAAHRMMDRLAASELPVVAACQGLALAGGLELMLACDVAFAAADARFGDQHAQYGLLPGFGGSQRLTRVLGPRRAMDLFLSARWIGADEALRWGLVNYVVEPAQLRAQALAYCHALAGRSRPGLALMKRLARAAHELPLADGLAMEAEAVSAALLGADVGEGLAAFRERRPPRFAA